MANGGDGSHGDEEGRAGREEVVGGKLRMYWRAARRDLRTRRPVHLNWRRRRHCAGETPRQRRPHESLVVAHDLEVYSNSTSAMEKALPPPYAAPTPRRPRSARLVLFKLPILVSLACFLVILYGFAFGQGIDFWQAYTRDNISPQNAAALAQCRALHLKPGPPKGFDKRTESDRYVVGTKAYLLKNAKIWTGEKNGTEVVHADILLDKGIIKGIGQTARNIYSAYKEDIITIDVKNAWVTPGYASHILAPRYNRIHECLAVLLTCTLIWVVHPAPSLKVPAAMIIPSMDQFFLGFVFWMA